MGEVMPSLPRRCTRRRPCVQPAATGRRKLAWRHRRYRPAPDPPLFAVRVLLASSRSRHLPLQALAALSSVSIPREDRHQEWWWISHALLPSPLRNHRRRLCSSHRHQWQLSACSAPPKEETEPCPVAAAGVRSRRHRALLLLLLFCFCFLPSASTSASIFAFVVASPLSIHPS
ncbi:hypothetical protein AHAS_Ahas13G0175100 [Arachis hypogaea]